MKLKYFFPSLIAAIAMLASCSDDNDPTYLSSAQVSSSYVTISPDGGSKKLLLLLLRTGHLTMRLSLRQTHLMLKKEKWDMLHRQVSCH